MPLTELNSLRIYLVSIFISLSLTLGAGYIQIRIVLAISDFKLIYIIAPSLIGLLFGILVARIILLNHKLEWYSIRDPLTNAFNHGYYKRIL